MPVPARPADTVPYDTGIAGAAALIADPTRAAMLRALISGRPLAAGELARQAGVSAATASFHLAKLLDGGMIDVARLFDLGWIERGLAGPHRRSVRITAAGGVGLAAARTARPGLAGRTLSRAFPRPGLAGRTLSRAFPRPGLASRTLFRAFPRPGMAGCRS